MGDLVALLPLVGIALLFWILIVRPNQRRQQQLRSVQNELAIGDEVLLTSGVYGVVSRLETERIGLEISPGVVIEVARQAVMRVESAGGELPDVPGDQHGEVKD